VHTSLIFELEYNQTCQVFKFFLSIIDGNQAFQFQTHTISTEIAFILSRILGMLKMQDEKNWILGMLLHYLGKAVQTFCKLVKIWVDKVTESLKVGTFWDTVYMQMNNRMLLSGQLWCEQNQNKQFCNNIEGFYVLRLASFMVWIFVTRITLHSDDKWNTET